MKKIEQYKESKKFDNFLILFSDIETIIDINETHKPVIISLIEEFNKPINFEGENCINDYMIYLSKNLNNSIIYFHNFGRFDSTFILKWITENKPIIGGVEIIERNNVIYQIRLVKFDIYFRDSYLIIPLSLKSIGDTFCDHKKKLKLDYDNITELYKENPQEVIKQCVNDCEVLKEGFDKFSTLVYNKFNIVLYKQLTLPSLAFNIFKKNYYDSEIRPIAKNPYKEDQFIRQSYAGGISEVFKPYLKKGYCYDANSLYPSVMLNNKYPTGKGKFIKGENIDIDSFIGFIECEVEIDKEVNFLTYRDHEKGLITPVGRWKSVYFHAEIKKAIELGYKIKFIKGFKYEEESYMFKDYVSDLYKIRVESKNKSMNNIAKLLLNSLYGRFGMKIFTESTKFISANDISKIKENFIITNVHYLGNDIYTLTTIRKSENDKDLYKNSIDTETAVQIASAVTSYARIFMYDFKNIKNNNCYYTDTDSIFVKDKIDSKFLNDELGGFKLEYEFEEAYFIAPKVYFIKIDNNVNKIVVKGLKKEEYTEGNLLKIFKKIINNGKATLEIKRKNIFKRNLLKLITYIQKIDISLSFPFNKRVKIFNNGCWVNTRALKIKKY